MAPGFIDLHAHLREPGNEDAETVATGLAAAAHGGFTTVCAMPNTTPALDEPGVLARVRAAGGRVAGRRCELLAHGAVTVGRGGETLAALGELADAGVVGFSRRRRAGPRRRRSCGRRWRTPGALGLPIVDHPEEPALTEGAEANDGFVATVLGLRGWPVAAEEAAVARDLAVLADVVRDVPGARLHLTHVSTAGALDLVRRAKAAGLPVTCDVTPHHLALTDEWIAGARRWAWDASGDPWARRRDASPAPYDSSLRVNPPLRGARRRGGRAWPPWPTARPTPSPPTTRPHTEVDKAVEFGGRRQRDQRHRDGAGPASSRPSTRAGCRCARAIEALTTGPSRVLAGRSRRNGSVGLRRGRAGGPGRLRSLGRVDS